MPGIVDLAALLGGLDPILSPEVYVFAGLPPGVPPPPEALMVYREAEGLTVIVEERLAEGLDALFRSRRLTLRVASSLEAVGMIAAIAKRLARHGIPVNPVAGFHHDHLFVPVERAEEALALLRAPFEDQAGST